MYRIAVCENDSDNTWFVKKLLEERYGNVLVIDAYEEARDLLNDWRSAGKPLQDILLMDIHFKYEDGIFVVEELQKLFGRICVIFMTGFAGYAERAFCTNPVYFLIKPLTKERLCTAVGKAMERLRKRRGATLGISEREGIILIPKDILYIESNLRILEIYGQNKKWTVKMKFSELMEKLPPHFVRVHQSFVVNMNYATALRGHKIELPGEVEIPVSRARYKEAREGFMSCFQGRVRDK